MRLPSLVLQFTVVAFVLTTGVAAPRDTDSGTLQAGGVSEASPDYFYMAGEDVEFLDEMLLRDKIRPDTNAVVNSLHDEKEYAGAWVTWKPLRFNVSVTGLANPRVLSALDSFPHQDLLVVHIADLDMDTLEEDLRTAIKMRDVGSLPPFDGMIDVEHNRLRFIVGDAPREDFSAVLKDPASNDFQATVVLDHSEMTTPATFGGGSLGNGCSSAFMIKSTSNSYFGPLSAGHGVCDSDSSYPGGLQTDGQLAVTSGRRDSSFHRITNGGSVSNEIYLDVSPYYRSITASVAWGYTSGDQVCKNGRSTSFKCGSVVNIYFSPSWVPGGERFIVFDNGCSAGDSGAPVFANNLSYGVLAGCSSSSTVFGSISYAIPSGYYLYVY